MGGTLQFFVDLGHSFLALSPLDKVMTTLGIAAPTVSVWGWARHRIRLNAREKTALYSLAETQKMQIDKLEIELGECNSAITSLREQLPVTWIEAADAERRDGNEELAVTSLRDGFEGQREWFGACCFQLAQHHLSLYVDSDRALAHLEEAHRQAQLAALMLEAHRDALGLLEEMRELMVAQELHGRTYDPKAAVWREPENWLYRGAGPAARPAVRELVKQAEQCVWVGRYRSAERLARRAAIIAERELEPANDLVGIARFLRTEALLLLGLYQESLIEAEELIPLLRQANGPEHIDTLKSRGLRADVLGHMGRSQEALEELDALVPLFEKSAGPDHPDTFTMQATRARVLNDLGRNRDALTQLEQMLPRQIQVCGAEDRNTLSTRCTRAQVLNDLGRFDDALTEINGLMELEEKALAPEHPSTLHARQTKAMVLCNLKRLQEAMAEVDALLPIVTRVAGEENPLTLMTRFTKAKVLHALLRPEDAMAELDSLQPLMTKVFGPDHSATISTLETRARMTGDRA